MVLGFMISPAMAVQNKCEGSHPNSVLPAANELGSSAGLHNATGLQLNDQFPCGNDYAPKARKPYTITKQRERWTEEEHKKFLEALKLYGRAWRKIEEHVGSKTAVQIRSHAQKFFSKVIRETSGNNTIPVEPLEIPPPRPKRKPMHPYPRKLAHSLVKESLSPVQTMRSSSPNFSVSEQENQSPTSVLSAAGSDASGSTDSNPSSGSLSPVSIAAPAHSVGFKLSQPNSLSEENGSLLPVVVTAVSLPDKQSPTVQNVLKLGPLPQVSAKEASAPMEACTRSLKLFGRTVLVTNSHRPSSPTVGTCKSLPSDKHEVKPLQLLPQKFTGTESWSRYRKSARNHLPHTVSGSLYYMQFPNENCNLVDASSGAPIPQWSFYGGMAFPITPYHMQESVKIVLDSDLGVVQDKQFEKEGSWTGSNSKSVEDENDNFDKNSDMETQSCQRTLDKEEKEPDSVFELKQSEKSAFSAIRGVKGFVPYKRRVAERDSQSSRIRIDKREEQRIRLSL